MNKLSLEETGTRTARTSVTPEEAGLAFFRAAYDAFEAASRSVGGVAERYYRIARCPIRLRFAGPALMPYITPAFEHLASERCAKASLTVCFFDTSSTRTRMPPAPWPADAYGPRGEIKGYNSGRIHTLYQRGVDALHMLDVQTETAIYWVRRPEVIPYWESGFPMRTILHWWTLKRPCLSLHAGAVGEPSGGVLIAGRSGSGKSTTTLACLHSDLSYAGDDFVLATLEPSPFVHSLSSSAKLEPENLPRFPELRSAICNFDHLDKEKALVFLNTYRPRKLCPGFPIRAILALQITGLRDTHVRQASPIVSLRAIAPTTICQLQGGGEETFAKLSALVKSVPNYILEVGTELSQIPRVISNLLAKSGA